jgi:membrane fusion protein, multidrug efflux system
VGELFAGAGQIKIVNTEHLKVTTQVPENYLNKVKIGTPVAVILPDLNISVNTSLNVAGKLIDPNSRSFFIEAKIPSANNFRPNQIAVVKIQDYVANNAITVPVNTLQTDEKGKYVLVAVKEKNKLWWVNCMPIN